MKRILRHIPVAVIGGLLYMGVELLFRGRTHPSMGVLGGVCFAVIGMLDEWRPGEKLWVQMALGAGVITAGELLVGLIVNVWLGLGVWDYSDMPGNLWGQICPQFTIAWFFLSGLAVWLENRMHDVINVIRNAIKSTKRRFKRENS